MLAFYGISSTVTIRSKITLPAVNHVNRMSNQKMETANGAKQSYENTDYQWIIWNFSLTNTKAF